MRIFMQSANACVECGVNDGDTYMCRVDGCQNQQHLDCGPRCIDCSKAVCSEHAVRVGEELYCPMCAAREKAARRLRVVAA